MDFSFKTKKLEKQCSTLREAVKIWGKPIGTAIAARLQDLEAADAMADLPPHPPTRIHPLTGSRAGQYAMDLAHPFRLIMEIDHDPIPRKSDGGVDFTSIHRVRILGVEDYH